MRQCPGDGNALSLANRQALRFAVRDTGNAELFQKCISRSYRLAQQAKRQAFSRADRNPRSPPVCRTYPIP